jgi:ArsR family transcriptional regulator
MNDYKEEILIKNYMPDKTTIKNLSTFFYAFSDDTRLKIIILLMIKPLCVGEITTYLNINQTTISHQLKILKSLNIVECDRQGKNVIYYIKNPHIETMFDATINCI